VRILHGRLSAQLRAAHSPPTPVDQPRHAAATVVCRETSLYFDLLSHTHTHTHAHTHALLSSGYFARVAAFDRCIQSFLEAGSPSRPKQIVCLGAGLDTTFFRLKVGALWFACAGDARADCWGGTLQQAAGRAPSLYVELDLPDNVRAKVMSVARSSATKPLLGSDVAISTQRGTPLCSCEC